MAGTARRGSVAERWRHIILLVLVVAVLAPGRHASAQSAPFSQGDQGLQGGWAVDNTGHIDFLHSLDNQLGFMQAAGAGWVRIDFRLGHCFADWTSIGCNGQTALQAYDHLVQDARARGLNILGLLTGESWHGTQADWTQNNHETTGGSGDNLYVDDFAQNAAGVLAAHYSGIIGEWEIWNEPNVWAFHPRSGVYTGGSFLYPSNFAWLLQRSYSAVKAADPTALVISGGLASLGPYDGVAAASCSGPVESGADYLCSTYVQGIANAGWGPGHYPFDGIGQHLYLDQYGTADASHIRSALGSVRRAYTLFEGPDTGKETYVTEVGWSTANVSASDQANDLRVAYGVFQTTSYVAHAFWFSVQNIPEAHLYYGLVDARGNDKPAFDAYSVYATYVHRAPLLDPATFRDPGARSSSNVCAVSADPQPGTAQPC